MRHRVIFLAAAVAALARVGHENMHVSRPAIDDVIGCAGALCPKG